jgi:hypothetical protein
MSNYVVHFTREYEGKSAFDNMLGILSDSRIEARSTFGVGRYQATDPTTQRAVCFSEIPLGLLKRLADRRSSEYGIVFAKNFIIKQGGNPILYAYKNNPLYDGIQALIAEAVTKADGSVWKVTPFVDAPGTYGDRKYFFEWEREWRKLDDLIFKEGDVTALILPEHLHERARGFFKGAASKNAGPSYEHHAFIDANWDSERILYEYGF